MQENKTLTSLDIGNNRLAMAGGVAILETLLVPACLSSHWRAPACSYIHCS